MPMKVEEGFREFHGRLTPTGSESDAARSHRASIEACLKSNFGMKNFFRTGSFGNGTSIRSYSDVDYFAVIPTEKLKRDSALTLREVKDTLKARFPNTDVKVSTPAVVVPFGTDASETTEIVPADAVETNRYRVFEIADGNGGWMRASPEAHNAYVTNINNDKENKVKPLIRFIKAWKYFNNVPISSFYLELRTAKYASGEQTIIYSIDFKNILKSLIDSNLASIQDPMGISGYISPCSTEAKKDEALSKLQTALKRAEYARSEESANRIPDAFYWWNMVFANQFPAYC
jgi:hypothetical protein